MRTYLRLLTLVDVGRAAHGRAVDALVDADVRCQEALVDADDAGCH